MQTYKDFEDERMIKKNARKQSAHSSFKVEYEYHKQRIRRLFENYILSQMLAAKSKLQLLK